MELPYNPENKESIVKYAKRLKGKTLRQACNLDITSYKKKGKGNFGQILEEYYFLYKPNSDSEPDFKKVRLELKSSPIRKLKNNEFRSKERLVLNIINFFDIVNQDFENSSFLNKNSNLLLVFYLFKSDSNILDYLIHIVDEWNFPGTDLAVIKRDWEVIKQKIVNGKAHELSEGDTFYLGACTKGANSNSTRKQPFNSILAKQRAYSLKQGYVNHLIASLSKSSTNVYGKLITDINIAESKSIEQVVKEKFQHYYGKSIKEIIKEIKINFNVNAKSFYSNLTKAILGIAQDKEIEEFKKADIIIKSIRVNKKNKIKENISFKTFKYESLVNESWEESEFKNILEHKFLFIFYKEVDDNMVLEKVKFWNMPFKDIQIAKKAWIHTKAIIKLGQIVREVKHNGRRHTNFIKKSENSVAHVRPHTNKTNNVDLLPTIDELTKANAYTKHSFWLNNTYIENEIYLK